MSIVNNSSDIYKLKNYNQIIYIELKDIKDVNNLNVILQQVYKKLCKNGLILYICNNDNKALNLIAEYFSIINSTSILIVGMKN
jgi:hypothetical protein